MDSPTFCLFVFYLGFTWRAPTSGGGRRLWRGGGTEIWKRAGTFFVKRWVVGLPPHPELGQREGHSENVPILAQEGVPAIASDCHLACKFWISTHRLERQILLTFSKNVCQIVASLPSSQNPLNFSPLKTEYLEPPREDLFFGLPLPEIPTPPRHRKRSGTPPSHPLADWGW